MSDSSTILSAADPRKPGEVYVHRYTRHVYRVVRVLEASEVPSWFPGWGIVVQHSRDGGATFERPVTHCTPFDATRDDLVTA